MSLASEVRLLKEFYSRYQELGSPSKIAEIKAIVNDCTSDTSEQEELFNFVTTLLLNGATLQDPERIIVLLHGIRTRALWQEVLREEFERHGHTVIPLGYDYFDVFKFLMPIIFRRVVVKRIKKQIERIADEYPQKELIIIAHSFGTYITAKILKTTPNLRVNKIILSGSIISNAYKWEDLSRIKMGQVINECGLKDFWPVFAKISTWGYGNTGTFGFKKALVRDRIHNSTHSEYLKLEFVRKFWLPYIDHGMMESSIESSTADSLRHPRLISLLGLLPTASLPIFILLMMVFFSG